MEDVNRYIDKELLHHLYRGLEQVQYSRVACAIRIKVLQCLKELLPIKEPAEFFQHVLQSFDQLADYLDSVCREEPHIPGPPCDEVTIFRRILQTYALTTEQLQLSYFRELCQAASAVSILSKEKIYYELIYFRMNIQAVMVKFFFVLHMKSSVVWLRFMF